MSIIEVDSKPIPKGLISSSRLTWQQKFRRNLYQSNYLNIIQNINDEPNIEQEQKKNLGVNSLKKLLKQNKNKSQSIYELRKQFYDNQTIQSHYSPYSVYIPLQTESYMSDQIINTFSYLSYLYDTAKRDKLKKHYAIINDNFKGAKAKGRQYVQQQWMKIKIKYLSQMDIIKAASLFIQLTRRNSQIIDQLFIKHGKGCIKQVFFYKLTKISSYIRSTLKMHKNLKISMQVGEQINQKTLPLTMKTWYCALCMCYDCQKHKLQSKAMQYQHQYISEKNKIKEIQNIQNIIKLLKYYQYINDKNSMCENQQNIQKILCSQQCYKKIKYTDLLKLNIHRHKLISPLAKSLLKLGIQMFSYDPCLIYKIFQQKHNKNNINCNLIFLHFVQQCNLIQYMNRKMYKNEIQYLLNQDSKLLNPNIKIPTNKQKVKKNTYLQKRQKNQNPQFAVCMHNFIGHAIIDGTCSDCVCRQRGFCLPSCLCTQNCEIQRIGCNCRGQDTCQTQKCHCFINKLQCQPDVCCDCFTNKNMNKKNNCRNDQILRQMHKHMIIGVSQVIGAGLGAYAGQNYNKNDLVCKYSGEHISSDVDFIRETMIKDISFYNFDSPNGKVISASIDARFLGNKARFINHANQGEQNLQSQTIFSNGTQYIALYASRDIKQGQQLSFNYDGNGQLYAQHRDKYPFIKAPVRKN